MGFCCGFHNTITQYFLSGKLYTRKYHNNPSVKYIFFLFCISFTRGGIFLKSKKRYISGVFVLSLIVRRWFVHLSVCKINAFSISPKKSLGLRQPHLTQNNPWIGDSQVCSNKVESLSQRGKNKDIVEKHLRL